MRTGRKFNDPVPCIDGSGQIGRTPERAKINEAVADDAAAEYQVLFLSGALPPGYRGIEASVFLIEVWSAAAGLV